MKSFMRNALALLTLASSLASAENSQSLSTAEQLNIIDIIEARTQARSGEIMTSTALVFHVEINPRKLSEGEMISGAQTVNRMSKGRVSTDDALKAVTERQLAVKSLQRRYEIFVNNNVSIADIYWPGDLGLQYGVILFKATEQRNHFVVYDPSRKTLHFRSGVLDIAPLFSLTVPSFEAAKTLKNLFSDGRVQIEEVNNTIRVNISPPPSSKPFNSGAITIYPVSRTLVFSSDEHLDLIEETMKSNQVAVDKKEYSDYRDIKNGIRFPMMISLSSRPLTSLSSEPEIKLLNLLREQTLNTSGSLYGLYLDSPNLDAGFAAKIRNEGWRVLNSAEDAELLSFPLTRTATIEKGASIQDNVLPNLPPQLCSCRHSGVRQL